VQGLKLIDRKMRDSNVIIGYVSAIAAAIFFGSVSTIAKPMLSTIDPIVLSSIIYLIAGAFFTPVASKKRSKITRKYYSLIVISAVAGATLAPVMFFLGLKLSTASDTALLANGETVFSILFALLIFKERLRPVGYIAVILILFGVFLVTTNLDFNSFTFRLNIGNVFVIASTIIWGFDNNICKIIARRVDVSKLIQLKALIGGSILLGTVLILEIPINIQSEQLIAIVVLGVFGFAISLYLYLHSIKRIGVVKASSLLSLSAVFGLVFAILFLHEVISIQQLIAILIMIYGIHLMYSHEQKDEIMLK
jgi:drug/metabolite transporter (DMT)-like permease